MTNQIDFTDDTISVEDMTDRVEELRETRDELREEFDAMPENAGVDFDNWVCNQVGFSRDEFDELQTLESALEKMAGYGGNHQWEGTWYPDYLIAESHFETAMDDLIDEIGDLPKDLPSYLTVSIDYAALRMDYTPITISGHDFLYR